MDPTVKFIIEAACLVGVILLAAVSTPALGGKRWDRSMWLRSTGVLVVGLVYLVVNPRGAPDLFPVVIGCTVFVVVLVGLMLAIALAWRFAHRERRTEIDQEAAVNLGAMGLFGVFAAVCLIAAVACALGLVQGLGDQSAYQHAPSCATVSSSSCRSQADARFVRRWAESSGGRHWIAVTVLGQNQAIQVATAYDVWQSLIPGNRVVLTSWNGHVTEVSLPGVGSMQTVDSPNFALIPFIALLVGSLVGLFMFSMNALMSWLKWLAASRGIDVDRLAA
ncbi:MAG TPA: hypothetical protein VHK65_15760 [Candidatus Dormibacteraeota bacterium]|nr:hypothetical protein [Candidatus Dormibacteraeota bacterium]